MGMVFEKFSQWAAQFSVGDLFRGDLSAIVPILYLAISITVYAILIWHFYRYIAKRDVFKIASKKHSTLTISLKYGLAFPLLVSLFFVGFALMLLFLANDLEIATILSTAFAIIIAIRITAYYKEDLSKDVAKLLPFVLLGVFLVDPAFFKWNDILAKIDSLPNFFTLCFQFIFIVVIIEWILRGTLILVCRVKQKKQSPSIEAPTS